MSRDEAERQYRLVDQQLTMHSVLRDRYGRLAMVVNCGLLTASIVLCGFVFAPNDVFSALGVNPEIWPLGLRISSIIILALSVVELKVDWNGTAREHERAVERLADLKGQYRGALDSEPAQEEYEELDAQYARVMDALPPIPEAKFNKLKAKHVFKIELSKAISEHPTCPVFILKWHLRWEGLKGMFRGGEANDGK